MVTKDFGPTQVEEARNIKIEVTYSWGSQCWVGTLRPVYHYDSGDLLMLPPDMAGKLFSLTKENSALHDAARRAEDAVKAHHNFELTLDGEITQRLMDRVSKALEIGGTVTDAFIGMVAAIKSQVAEETGRMPEHLALFSYGAPYSTPIEVDTMMEPNWERSALRRRLLDAKEELDSLSAQLLENAKKNVD